MAVATPPRSAGRFGRLPTKDDPRTLRLSKYLASTLPPAPTSYSSLPTIFAKLGVNDISEIMPMDGNDRYGDCVICGRAHAIATWRGLLGQRKVLTVQQVEQLYFELTGGSDSGLVILDTLNWWRQNALDDEEIGAFVKLDVGNWEEVQHGISIFGGCLTGSKVTREMEQQFREGQAWTPGSVIPGEGHCEWVFGYEPGGGDLSTWGGAQAFVKPWWDQCVEEAYIVLPKEAEDPNFTPGVDLEQLQYDLQAIVGNAPAPPVPVPDLPPAPPEPEPTPDPESPEPTPDPEPPAPPEPPEPPAPPTPADEFSIGPGVRAIMAELGDTPASDEEPVNINSNGNWTSRTETVRGATYTYRAATHDIAVLDETLTVYPDPTYTP